MNNVVFLLTKDCMSCESLPLYGNRYWNTPNIDELAENGTVFRKHYAAAASTAMSMSAMLTGHYPYEFKQRKTYTDVNPGEFLSIFDYFQNESYECHLIWDITWMDMAWRFVREFGDESKTKIHNIDIAQPAGGHKKSKEKLVRNDSLLEQTYEQICSTIDSIDFEKKQFVWMHLPHVLKGRRSYMDDMDVFDEVVGYVREKVGDDSIFVSTDHGHMNMHKGKVGYGFDVYEPIIHIPLIAPWIEGMTEVTVLTSNIDLPRIIIERKIPSRNYVIADTTYYAQPTRKTAIVTERFKYIYNKPSGKEELYDLYWDPQENYNILVENYFDYDRITTITYDELYFYPYKNEALRAYKNLKKHKEDIWREPSFALGSYLKIRKKLSNIKKMLKN